MQQAHFPNCQMKFKPTFSNFETKGKMWFVLISFFFLVPRGTKIDQTEKAVFLHLHQPTLSPLRNYRCVMLEVKSFLFAI